MGLANYTFEEYKKAITYYNKAIKLNNKVSEFYYNRANARFELDRVSIMDRYDKYINFCV